MTRFLFVMLTVCLFIIILTAEAYALRLNEIEANPEGDDSGFEWVELYSAESVSLEGYVLDHNSSGGPVNLSGSFQGLFIITFPSQWLRNTNEVIYLKLNENVIDTAGPFTDNKKNKTYSFCNTWIFIADSRNAENACSSSSGSGGTQTQTQIQNQSRQSSNTEEREEEIPRTTIEQNNNLEDNNQNNIINLADDIPIQKPKKIFLNGKTTDKNIDVEVTKTYKTRVGVIYFFIALCVLLVVLIASRKL